MPRGAGGSTPAIRVGCRRRGASRAPDEWPPRSAARRGHTEPGLQADWIISSGNLARCCSHDWKALAGAAQATLVREADLDPYRLPAAPTIFVSAFRRFCRDQLRNWPPMTGIVARPARCRTTTMPAGGGLAAVQPVGDRIAAAPADTCRGSDDAAVAGIGIACAGCPGAMNTARRDARIAGAATAARDNFRSRKIPSDGSHAPPADAGWRAGDAAA